VELSSHVWREVGGGWPILGGVNEWTIEPYVDATGGVPFDKFLDDLDDAKADACLMAIELMLARHGLNLASTQWLKALGDGLWELRVRHDAPEIRRSVGVGAVGDVDRPTSVLLRVF
jgi:putative component of toxin-antitoxin plasmid stabilization module